MRLTSSHLLIIAFISFFTIKMSAQCEQLVWADEFSGTSLDLTKWTPIVGEGGAVSGNAELQYYLSRPENIQVNNGSLKIIALNDGYASNAYTSGRMQSKNLGDFLYGRFEARIKLPVGYGMWPAFWMLPTDNTYGVWPRSGEIDIMELIGRQPSTTYATIHTSSDAVDHGFGDHYILPTGNFNDAFHTFSVDWSPNLLKFYMDGILYSTQTNTSISPYPWVFNKRFYMLLNLAIGGPWALAPNGTTTFPQIMEVDYVRVYQKISDIALTGKNLVEPSTPSVVYTVPSVAGMTYNWSVSGSGNTIASGQGTSQAAVNWANASGTVSALLNDGCTPSATVSMPVTVTANLWDNYGFEQSYVSWATRPANSSTVTFSTSTSDFTEGSKAACIQTNTVGANPWDIQLSRTNLNLTAGTSYTMRFKAKANANRTIPTSFIRTSNFTTVAAKSINLTTSWQSFSLVFTPTNNENVMWNADLAAQLGTNCFDDFVFARTAVLPIELIDFKGVAQKDGNHLTWETAMENDVQSFDIERLNAPNAFETIGSMKAKNQAAVYSFTDEQPTNGLNYYRLKIVDMDGKTTFSKTISLENGKVGGGIKIYPNPANVILTIENAEGKDIEIVNVLGQVVMKSSSTINHLSLTINHLKSGVYFVKTADEMVRFVKN